MDPKHKDVKSVAEADEIEALFVQNSHGMSYEDGNSPCTPWRLRPCSSPIGPTG